MIFSFFQKLGIFPYVSLGIHCSWLQYWGAWLSLLVPEKMRARINRKITDSVQEFLQGTGTMMPGYSVRTLFDLYLSVMHFPPGSEIIMSAVNILDMDAVVRAHGLVPVAWDLDLNTAAPRMDLLDKLVTKKTVAMVVAHIYGKRSSITELLAYAKARDLQVIEDYAEILFDRSDLQDFHADLRLYSLGLIKNHTAFGGALAYVRDGSIGDQMHALCASYHKQNLQNEVQKIAKGGVLMLILNVPFLTGTLIFLTRKFPQLGLDQAIQNSLRAFPHNMLARIRQQASTSLLLRLLWSLKRAQKYDSSDIKRKGDLLAQHLPCEMTSIGRDAEVSNYWLYPVLVNDKEQIMRLLTAAGYFSIGKTSLRVIADANKDCLPVNARRMVENTVYLPFGVNIPDEHFAVLLASLSMITKVEEAPVTLTSAQVGTTTAPKQP